MLVEYLTYIACKPPLSGANNIQLQLKTALESSFFGKFNVDIQKRREQNRQLKRPIIMDVIALYERV